MLGDNAKNFHIDKSRKPRGQLAEVSTCLRISVICFIMWRVSTVGLYCETLPRIYLTEILQRKYENTTTLS